MKRAIRLPLTVLALLLAVGSIALAQKPNVRWKVLTPTLDAKAGQTVQLRVEATVGKGSHMYSLKPNTGDGPQPTEVTVGEPDVITLAGPIRTSKKPIEKYDENFELNTEFWEGTVTFTIPVRVGRDVRPGSKAKAWVNFYCMTCSDSTCTPGDDFRLPLTLALAADTSSAAADSTATAAPADTSVASDTTSGDRDTAIALGGAAPGAPPKSAVSTARVAPTSVGDVDDLARARKQGLFAFLGVAALAGFLALLTPCVYPMVPITVSFFTKRTQTSRRRSLRDAALYALGIILTFTGIGVVASVAFGASAIQDFATNPIVNLAIAGLFVVLALNLFGLFEIQVPTSLLNRLNRKAQQDGDSVSGVILMGLVFSLTSFTCSVPAVGAILGLAGGGGDWVWPLLGMLVFSSVFAAPFFLLALFPALLKSMPKSGGWLNAVKVVMGFMELAAAIKFLSNADLVWSWGVFTRELFLAIWIAIAVLTTVYLLGRFQLPHDSPVDKVGPIRVMFAVAMLSIAFWLGIGVLGGSLGDLDAFVPPQDYPGKGNTSPLASLMGAGAMPGAARAEATTGSTSSGWLIDRYDEALAKAKAMGKPIFVDFTGYTCTNCRWMEKHMFTRPDVVEMLNKYVLVRLYTDRRDSINRFNRELQLSRLGTVALPYYAIITPHDSIVARFAFTREPDEFLGFLATGIEQKLAAR
jgi:thiol:disulfide interchange protein DsbD